MSAKKQESDDINKGLSHGLSSHEAAGSFADPSQPSTSMDPGTSSGTNRPAPRRRTNSESIGGQEVSPRKITKKNEEVEDTTAHPFFPHFRSMSQLMERVRGLKQHDEHSNPNTASVNREVAAGQSDVPAITVTTAPVLTGLPAEPPTTAATLLSPLFYPNLYQQSSGQSSASDTASESVSPYQLLMNPGNTGLFGNVFDPRLMNPQPANVLNTFNPVQARHLFANLSHVLNPTMFLGKQTRATLQPENQPSTSSAHSSASHSTSGISRNAGLLKNVEAMNSPVHRTRNTRSTLNPRSQHSVSAAQSLDEYSLSIAKDVDFRDYLMFNYTFSQDDLPNQPNVKSWISGILAVLSNLFTGEVPSSEQEGVDVVRFTLISSFESELAMAVLRRLNLIVEEENNKNTNVFPCELYPFFLTLVLLVGSLRDNIRKKLFSHVSNVFGVQELLKQLVHKIVIYLEEECTRVMGNLVDTSEQQKEFVRCIKNNSRVFLNGEHLKVLGSLFWSVDGFTGICSRHDFPTANVFGPLLGMIKAREAAGKAEKVDDQRAAAPPQVENSNAPLTRSRARKATRTTTESIPEFSNLESWTIGVLSFIYKHLAENTSVSDYAIGSSPDERAKDFRELYTIADKLSKLPLVDGSNLGEAVITKLREFENSVKKVCEHLMSKRTYENYQFSEWEKEAKFFIENLLTSPKNVLVKKDLNKLNSLFGTCHL